MAGAFVFVFMRVASCHAARRAEIATGPHLLDRPVSEDISWVRRKPLFGRKPAVKLEVGRPPIRITYFATSIYCMNIARPTHKPTHGPRERPGCVAIEELMPHIGNGQGQGETGSTSASGMPRRISTSIVRSSRAPRASVTSLAFTESLSVEGRCVGIGTEELRERRDDERRAR